MFLLSRCLAWRAQSESGRRFEPQGISSSYPNHAGHHLDAV